MEVIKYGAAGTSPLHNAGKTEPATSSKRPVGTARTDRLELSKKALEELQTRLTDDSTDKAEKGSIAEMINSSNEQAKAASEQARVLSLCLKIAARIMVGDNVPPKDQQYLMKNQPELYRMAISLRRTKEDPEDHKSLVEDEEDQSNATKVSASGAAADLSFAVSSGASAPAAEAPDLDGLE